MPPDDDSELPPASRGLPESDEDPAEFWGPDWKEKLDHARADAAAGRGDLFLSDEEFLAALEADSHA
jgi:hypothetical protein